jgi:HK97 family phage portal protein
MNARGFLANTLSRLASWLSWRAMPAPLGGSQWTGTGFVDSYKRNRNPTPNEILAELKSTAWTCASLNAQACANHPPSLYVTTEEGQARPKCETRPVSRKALQRLKARRGLARRLARAKEVRQVTDHPLLTLLAQCNPVHNAFDLWELTTLYQEVHGSAYWYLDVGPFGVPEEIWILPAQNVQPQRAPNSPNLVDYYLYRTGGKEERFDPRRIIHFRYPDPRDPYTSGLSPLRACFEQVALASEFSAFKKAKFENRALPDAVISPAGVIGEEERVRFENEWNQRLRRGGAGKIVVGESPMRVDVLSGSLGDLAALADLRACKEDILNAFHVPPAFFTTSTNLANLQASQIQHAEQCLSPRLTRRDEKLNEQLIPWFDPSPRLFFLSDDPVPPDPASALALTEMELKYGVRTINEVRQDDGLAPVAWGDEPWIYNRWEQPSQIERNAS